MSQEELDPTPELTTRALARHIERHETIGSTSDRAKELAAKGAAHGTCVVSLEQTAGRGSHGRRWHSPRGAGLYVSFVLRPKIPIARAPLLTLTAAVACQNAIESAVGTRLGIKWPNDLLARDDGPNAKKKVAGILVEVSSDANQLAHAVVGVGLNLLEAQRPPALAAYATSLTALKATSPTPSKLLAHLANALEAALDLLESGQAEALLSEWRDNALGIGERVTVRDPKAELHGVLRGVTEHGSLLLDTSEGTRELHVGELLLEGAPRRPPDEPG